jgi:hypothetical protein
MSSYAKQKVYEAVHALVGDGNLDKRLTLAGDPIVRLRAEDVPESLRIELEAIKTQLYRSPLSSDRSYVASQISEEGGEILSRRILTLFVKLSGGL